MKYSIDHVISAAFPSVQSNAVISDVYNGVFEHLLTDTGIQIFSAENLINREFRHNKFPNNINMLPKGLNYIPNRFEPSAIIINSRQENMFSMMDIAEKYHLNVILFEHELPLKNVKTNIRKYINSRIKKNVTHVYPYELVKYEWHLEDSGKELIHIPYGIPNLKSDTEKDIDVLMVGDYQSGDRDVLEEILAINKNCVGVGYNNGLTKEYDDFKDIYKFMQRAKICVSLYPENQPPLYAMLAASAGAIPVVNRTRWTENLFIEQMVFDDITKIKKTVDGFLNDTGREQIAAEIQDSILKQFDYAKFTKAFKDTIHSVSKKIYKP